MSLPVWTGPLALGNPERLDVVRSYQILDTPREERFDRLTRLVAGTLNVPVSIITIADADRLWYKSAHGAEGTETLFCEVPHGAAFCAEVISYNRTLVVENAQDDPRFACHPFVIAGGIGFYAGVPLRSPLGHVLGTLCALDAVPRTLTPTQLTVLEDLACTVVDELELTRHAGLLEASLEELKAAQAQTQQVLDATRTGFLAVDRQWRFTHLNLAGERLLNRELQDLLGKTLWEAFPESVGSRFSEEYHYAMESGTAVRFETYFPPFDRWYEVRAFPFEEGLSVYFDDITERHLVEEARREYHAQVQRSEEQYRALSHLVQTFAYSYEVPEDGSRPTIEWITGSVEEVLGHTPGVFEGAPWGTLIRPEHQQTSEERLRAALEGQSRIDDMHVVDKDGEARWVRFVSHPVVDPKTGRVVRILGAGQDVTAQKKADAELVAAKEQAEQMMRLKDAFLSNMSHEIRTPLTSIIGFSEILRDVVDEEARELVDLIEAGGRRLTDTLTSVLELSQLKAEGVVMTPSRIDVRELTRETVDLLRVQANNKGIVIHPVPAGAAIEADVDPSALGRILTNLVGNAIKFTNSGGHVAVDVQQVHEGIRFVVRDTGIGIADDYLPHLFEEFRQESLGHARTHEGSGLGLAITKRLVDLMGGTIRVESRKGHGSTFTVMLPKAIGAAGSDDVVLPCGEGAPFSRVLVVEDDKSTRTLVSVALGAMDVVVAQSAEEAFAAASSSDTPFGVVLMSINLGGRRTGEDILPGLREIPTCQGARFVAMTGYALPGDRERFLNAGFDGYLAKPFSRADLLRACQERSPAET